MTLEKLFHALSGPPDLHNICEDSRGLSGTCYTDSQCRAAGGGATGAGSCSSTSSVCCIVSKSGCDVTASVNNTVWQNGDIEAVPLECSIRVQKLSPNICHLRLNFIKFQLASPTNGACVQDKLVVYGQNVNSGIPHLCGYNTDQHIYIDVGTVEGPLDLSMQIGSGDQENDPKWEMQISQIACNSPYRPPANCLQYFTGPSNTISSFNFRIDVDSTYTNFLNYAICIRKEKGYCAIEYTNTETPGLATFDIVNKVNNNGEVIDTTPEGEAGVGLSQCPNDYLVLGGVRVCGNVLNDGATNPKFTENAPVQDRTNGPFIAQFTSDGEYAGRGFKLDYQQMLC